MAAPSKTRGLDVHAAHARYVSGDRLRDLCAEYELSADAMRKWFRRHGLRSDVQAHCGRYMAKPKGDLADHHARYIGGDPLADVARDAGISRSALYRAFVRAGLSTYANGQHPNSRNLGGRDLRTRGTWRPIDDHECIAADGICILCDRRVA